jgi:hypothetical protein
MPAAMQSLAAHTNGLHSVGPACIETAPVASQTVVTTRTARVVNESVAHLYICLPWLPQGCLDPMVMLQVHFTLMPLATHTQHVRACSHAITDRTTLVCSH